MKKQRKHYTPEEKVVVLRRHLLEKEPISKLCDELGLQPTVFYRWQKEFFENGAAAFEQRARPNHSADQERIGYLEKKIQTKDEVLAELLAERCRHRGGQPVQRVAGESMTEADIEIILQGAKENHPEARPRIISDNGPQFIAKDFKEFIRISGMTHVRTSPFYPQSKGRSSAGTNRSKGSASAQE